MRHQSATCFTSSSATFGVAVLISNVLLAWAFNNNTSAEGPVRLLSSINEFLLLQSRAVLEGGVIAVIANIGVFGNLLSMYILLRKKLDLQPFLCRLLILLVAFDTLFLVAEFSLYSLPELNHFYFEHYYPHLAPKLLIPLSQIALTGSVYSIVGITVERYICCCYPHIPPREGPAVNILAIGGIIMFSVLFNITRFFEYKTVEREETYSDVNQGENYTVFYYDVDPTPLRGDREYIRFYLSLAGASIMVLIPLSSLMVLNWRIHRAIKQQQAFRASLQVCTNTVRRVNGEVSPSNQIDAVENSRTATSAGKVRGGLTTESGDQRREVTISQILVIIVVVFLLTQSFKVIVVSYEVFNHLTDIPDSFPAWIEVLILLNHVALATNAALNIVIYICKDKKFRRECLQLVCPRRLRRNKFWCVKRSNNGSDTTASDMSERLQEAGESGRRGTREIMLPSDKLSGLSTSRGPLTPRRDVIMDIVSDNRSNKGRDRDIHNSVPTQSVMQLTERARDSPILKTTSIGELIERETFLQE